MHVERITGQVARLGCYVIGMMGLGVRACLPAPLATHLDRCNSQVTLLRLGMRRRKQAFVSCCLCHLRGIVRYDRRRADDAHCQLYNKVYDGDASPRCNHEHHSYNVHIFISRMLSD